jgi:hypothetical protein
MRFSIRAFRFSFKNCSAPASTASVIKVLPLRGHRTAAFSVSPLLTSLNETIRILSSPLGMVKGWGAGSRVVHEENRRLKIMDKEIRIF